MKGLLLQRSRNAKAWESAMNQETAELRNKRESMIGIIEKKHTRVDKKHVRLDKEHMRVEKHI